MVSILESVSFTRHIPLGAKDRSGESISARAYRVIERMLVTLELEPESVVTEALLVERVGLGRTPVREAVQRLSWEGLLDVRARAGIAVAPLHPADWVKIIDARWGAERVLARSAARHASRTSRRDLGDAAAAMRDAAADGDVIGFLDADRELDEAVASAGQNRFAIKATGPLQTHSRRFWYRFSSGDGLVQSARLHLAQVKAILENDAEAAENRTDELMNMMRAEAVAAARD